MGRLRNAETVNALAQAALAPATIRAYEATWWSLQAFLGRLSLSSTFPVLVSEVADFVAARFNDGSSASALATHCSAIAYGHRIRGLPDPTSDFRIRKLLAGARRLRPSEDKRSALTIAELNSLCAALAVMPFSPLEKSALKAAFTLAFFGMLRPGEVAVGGTPAHTIRLGNVQMQLNTLTVTVPSSKTSLTPFTFHLQARDDMVSCPFGAMSEYLRLRPAGKPSDFLFISNNRQPLTSKRLINGLRKAGSYSNIDESKLAGHCFRIGGASHGARQGMSEMQLREAGRWRSSAMRRYLRRPVSLLEISDSDRV